MACVPICETLARAAPGPAAGAWYLALRRAKLKVVIEPEKARVQQQERIVPFTSGAYVYGYFPVPMRDNVDLMAAWCVRAIERQFCVGNRCQRLSSPPLLVLNLPGDPHNDPPQYDTLKALYEADKAAYEN